MIVNDLYFKGTTPKGVINEFLKRVTFRYLPYPDKISEEDRKKIEKSIVVDTDNLLNWLEQELSNEDAAGVLLANEKLREENYKLENQISEVLPRTKKDKEDALTRENAFRELYEREHEKVLILASEIKRLQERNNKKEI